MSTKLKLALVLVSAACFYFSTGLETVWPLAWIAPLPVLYLALGESPAKTGTFIKGWLRVGLPAWAAYFLGGLNMFAYYHVFLSAPLILLFMALNAAAFAVAVRGARFVYLRLPPLASVFAFPAVWTAWEFLLSRLSVHGTWQSLAYTQTDFLALLQIASFTGLFGVTFVLTLVPSAVAVALAGWFPDPALVSTARPPRRGLVSGTEGYESVGGRTNGPRHTDRAVATKALIFTALIFALVIGFGLWRLRGASQNNPPTTIKVGLAATDSLPDDAFRTRDPAVALDVTRRYADRIRRLAAQGAQVVVLPEKFVGVTAADFGDVSKILSDSARDASVTLIAGVNQVDPRPPRNLALVFGPGGGLQVEYDKRHMLPGPESGYVIGEKPGLFGAAGEPWGVEICKDMDFPRWARVYGQGGVRLMAVPAWDFVTDRRLHSRMAMVRGVENGFTIARAARNGLLTFSDAYGRVLAELPSDTKPDALLVRDIPPGPGATFYTRFGDWFGWKCVAVSAALLGAAIFFRRRAA